LQEESELSKVANCDNNGFNERTLAEGGCAIDEYCCEKFERLGFNAIGASKLDIGDDEMTFLFGAKVCDGVGRGIGVTI